MPMSDVLAVRVRNLRSLLDTNWIELRPINVLVGKNSAGKSTFARVFPLFSQSQKDGKRGPIIWFDKYVDFGAFGNAVSRNIPDGVVPSITFEFKVRLHPSARPQMRRRSSRLLESADVSVRFDVRQRLGGAGTFTHEFDIAAWNHKANIRLSEDGHVQSLSVNERSVQVPKDIESVVTHDGTLPDVAFIRPFPDQPDFRIETDFLITELKSAIRSVVHGNTTNTTISQIANGILLGSDSAMIEALRRNRSGPDSWNDAVRSLSTDSPIFRRISEGVFTSQVLQIARACDYTLSNYFSKVRYIKPVRATASRFYRQTDAGVSEIDADGQNVAIFLDSLSAAKKIRLNRWMKREIGFEVDTKETQGNISILVKPEGATDFMNMADMGFGFSQLLPVAAQLWLARHGENSPTSTSPLQDHSLVVIEQPELHLHPEYQARIANLFANVVSPNEGSAVADMSILAETHSPHLINRLGELVSKGRLSRESVQIILFEFDDATKTSKTRVANFDSDGVLENWPFGFFDPLPLP